MGARTCKYSGVEFVPHWAGQFGAVFGTLGVVYVHAGEEDFLDQLGQGE